MKNITPNIPNPNPKSIFASVQIILYYDREKSAIFLDYR